MSSSVQYWSLSNFNAVPQEAVLDPVGMYGHYQQATHVAACSGGTSGLVPWLCGKVAAATSCKRLTACWSQIRPFDAAPFQFLFFKVHSLVFDRMLHVCAWKAALAMEQIFLGRPFDLQCSIVFDLTDVHQCASCQSIRPSETNRLQK